MNVTVAGPVTVAIAGILLGGALAVAQGPGGMGPGAMGRGPGFGQHQPPMERAFGPQARRGEWWNNPRLVEQLKLTDDQRKAMDGIMLQHREKLIDLQGTLEKAELEMEPLMQADQPNETQILAQIDKTAQARAELEKANARFLLDLRAKLTPDQWKQLQTLRASGMRHQEGAGQGPGRDQQRQWRRGPGSQQGNPPPPQGGQGGGQNPPPPGSGEVQ